MAISKFQKRNAATGSKPTYKCRACGHNTRETGYGESGIKLCAYCYEVSGEENSYQDDVITVEELASFMGEMAKLFNVSEERVRKAAQFPETLAILYPTTVVDCTDPNCGICEVDDDERFAEVDALLDKVEAGVEKLEAPVAKTGLVALIVRQNELAAKHSAAVVAAMEAKAKAEALADELNDAIVAVQRAKGMY